jgi:orotidine-5'-phosphate decarboxylase
MSERNFREMLTKRQQKVNSLVCVGLDPLPERLPDCVAESRTNSTAEKVMFWMRNIVDATAPFVSMFKPQRAHWEAMIEGEKALGSLIHHIQIKHPDIPVFLDCKRGDIDRTQERYRIAHFDLDGADGINFSPYMGKSCMAGLVDKEHLGRALVGLCYTSNPSAREVQDVLVEYVGVQMPYWQFIARRTLQWACELEIVENAGLVMAAAYESPKGSGNIYSEHLTICRQLVGKRLWFLIPGIGTQGGFIKETVKASYAGPGSIAINSSSEIIFAGSGEYYATDAAKKAEELRDAINAAL